MPYTFERNDYRAQIVSRSGGRQCHEYRTVKAWDIFEDGRLIAGGLTNPGFESQRPRFQTKAKAGEWAKQRDLLSAAAASRATN